MLTRDNIIQLYIALGEAERQFSNIQNSYRLLASTWLIATLVGIGYVLTNKISISLDPEIICAGIGFSGAVSIWIIWLIDIQIYQRLLSENYDEGLALEQGQSWLPQVRSQTRGTFKGGLSRLISIYYISLLVFLCMVSCLFLVLKFKFSFALSAPNISVVALATTGAVIALWMWISQAPDKVKRTSYQIDRIDLAARAASYRSLELSDTTVQR